MNTVNFGSDSYGVEESTLANKLRMAQMIQAQAMDGQPLYSGRAALAKVLMGALGGFQAQEAEKSQRELAGRKEQGRKAEIEAIFREVEGGAPGVKPLTPNDDEGNAMPSVPGSPGQRMTLARLLAGSSNPEMARAGLSMAMKGPEAEEAYTLKPGEQRFRGGRVVAQVPESVKPDGPKKGDLRKLIQGGEEVQQEFDGTKWGEIGRGSRWQPQQADRSLVEVQDPKNPSATILVPRDQAVGKAGAQSVAGARSTREDADGLRKEFNALPVVKNLNEVRPIVESVKKAPDTPQGDLAMVYAVGKVLDPGSVVREGEMELVIKAGSPLERLMGSTRLNFGKGRITPEMRGKLVEMLDGRVAEYEKQFQGARSTYEGIAKQRGHDASQIFTNPGAKTVTRTGTLNGRKVVQYSDGTTDYAD